jgi:uncharacterized membrane protein HdeD (DUF308 family)
MRVIELLMRNWWALAVRGASAILFALVIILWPDVLVLFFGAYLLLDGFFAIIAGLRATHRHERGWPLAIEGAFGLLAGLVLFTWPDTALLAFVYVTAIWAVLSGLALIAAALRLRHAVGERLLMAGGAVSLFWGLLVIVWPAVGAYALAWWVGGYALIFGVIMLSFALRLRRQQLEMAGR